MGKVKETIKKAWRDYLKIPTYIVLAYHLAGEAKFLYDYSTYKDERLEKFKEYSGIEIYAKKESMSNSEMMDLLRVIKTMDATSNDIDEIIVENEGYFSKSFMGKFLSWGEKSGQANPITGTMTIVNKLNIEGYIHEITHSKTFASEKEEELLEEWKKLATDSSGNSRYVSFGKMIKAYCGLAKKPSKDPKLDSLGFPTTYARTNVYEHIAEFVQEEQNKIFYSYATNFKDLSNEIYEREMDVAIKYSLMPKETREGYELKAEYKNWADHMHEYRQGDYFKKQYLIKSEKFLENYPNSPFAINIIIDRAMVLSNTSDIKTTIWKKESEKELQRALKYTSHPAYIEVLRKLDQISSHLYSGQSYRYDNPYTKAIKEYTKRVENFDTKLLDIGVNDKLQELGVLKP
ncbi:MAG TPA: hypothetical protein VEC16_00380 [Alphaproteobacteria bacterium]|nr:hypothetical protein [Alphaproteobacteria bacterium]